MKTDVPIINKILDSRGLSLIARILVTFDFWWTGIGRITDWPRSVAYMADHGLHPAPAFSFAVMVTQILAPLMILWGPLSWMGVGWLVTFAVLTIPIANPFWEGGPDAARQMHTAIIVFTLIGGLLLASIVRRYEARDRAGDLADQK